MNISLRNKILRLFLGLMILSSIATMTSVLLATSSSVVRQSQEKLEIGKRVFDQLMNDRAQVSISDRNRLLAIIASMHSEVVYQ